MAILQLMSTAIFVLMILSVCLFSAFFRERKKRIKLQKIADLLVTKIKNLRDGAYFSDSRLGVVEGYGFYRVKYLANKEVFTITCKVTDPPPTAFTLAGGKIVDYD